MIVTSKIVKKNNQSAIYYRPVIEYKYSINNKKYLSKVIGYYVGFIGKKTAREIIGNKQNGDEVTVYYLSAFPNISVINPGLHQIGAWLITLITCSVILLVTSLVLFANEQYHLHNILFGFVHKIT